MHKMLMAIVVLVSALILTISCAGQAPTQQSQSMTKGELIDITPGQIQEQMDGKGSDIRLKEQVWQQYRGKRVEWAGTLVEATEGKDYIIATFDVATGDVGEGAASGLPTGKRQVTITFDKSQSQELTNIRPGSILTFEGTLAYHGEIPTTSAVDDWEAPSAAVPELQAANFGLVEGFFDIGQQREGAVKFITGPDTEGTIKWITGPEAEGAVTKGELIDMTPNQIQEQMDGKGSDIQLKEQVWQQYQGKRVQWAGTLIETTEKEDYIIGIFDVAAGDFDDRAASGLPTGKRQVTVTFKKCQAQDLTNIKPGSILVFEGILAYHGEIPTTSAVDDWEAPSAAVPELQAANFGLVEGSVDIGQQSEGAIKWITGPDTENIEIKDKSFIDTQSIEGETQGEITDDTAR